MRPFDKILLVMQVSLRHLTTFFLIFSFILSPTAPVYALRVSQPESSSALTGLEESLEPSGLEGLFREVGGLLKAGAPAERIAEQFLEPLRKSHRDSGETEYRMEFLRRLYGLLEEVHAYGPGKGKEGALERLRDGLVQASQAAEESVEGPYRGIAIRRFEPVIDGGKNTFTVLSTYTTGRPSFVTEAGMQGIHAALASRAGDRSLRFAEVGTGHGLVSAWVAAAFPNEEQVFAVDSNFRSEAVLKVNALLNFSPGALRKVEFIQADVAPAALPSVDHVFLNPNQRPGKALEISSEGGQAASDYYRDVSGGDGLTLAREVMKKWSSVLRGRGSLLLALVDWHNPDRLKQALRGDGMTSEQIPGVGTVEEYRLAGEGGRFTKEDLDNFTAAEARTPSQPFQFEDVLSRKGILNAQQMAERLRSGGRVLVAAHVYQVRRAAGLEEPAKPEPFTDDLLSAPDRQQIQALLGQLSEASFTLRDPKIGDLEGRYRSPHFSFIARDPAGGQIIGFVSASRVRDEGADVLYLSYLVVDKERRREGIGRRLMEAVFQAAEGDPSFRVVEWDTPRSNADAQEFYDRLPGVRRSGDDQGRWRFNIRYQKPLRVPADQPEAVVLSGLEKKLTPWSRLDGSPHVLVRPGPVQPVPIGYEVRLAEYLQDEVLTLPELRQVYGAPVPLVPLPRASQALSRKVGRPVTVLLRREPFVLPTRSTKPRMLAVLFDLFLNGDPHNITGLKNKPLPLLIGTQSTGNHGFALAWFGSFLRGLKGKGSWVFEVPPQVVIYANQKVPRYKVTKITSLGAELLTQFPDYGTARDEIRKKLRDREFLYWQHGNRPIILGNMTSAVEFYRAIQKNPVLRDKKIAVVSASGAGGRVSGLSGGLTQLMGDRVKVIAAETDRTKPVFLAMEKGEPVRVPSRVEQVAEDGIDVDEMERAAFEVFHATGTAVVTVPWQEQFGYTRWLMQEMKEQGKVFGWDTWDEETETVTGVSLAALFNAPELLRDTDVAIIDETGRNIELSSMTELEEAPLPPIAAGLEEAASGPGGKRISAANDEKTIQETASVLKGIYGPKFVAPAKWFLRGKLSLGRAVEIISNVPDGLNRVTARDALVAAWIAAKYRLTRGEMFSVMDHVGGKTSARMAQKEIAARRSGGRADPVVPILPRILAEARDLDRHGKLSGLEEVSADETERRVSRRMAELAEARTGRGLVVVQADQLTLFEPLGLLLKRLPEPLASSVILWGEGPEVDRLERENPALQVFREADLDKLAVHLAEQRTIHGADGIALLGERGTADELNRTYGELIGVDIQQMRWSLSLILQALGVPADALGQVDLPTLLEEIFTLESA